MVGLVQVDLDRLLDLLASRRPVLAVGNADALGHDVGVGAAVCRLAAFAPRGRLGAADANAVARATAQAEPFLDDSVDRHAVEYQQQLLPRLVRWGRGTRDDAGLHIEMDARGIDPIFRLRCGVIADQIALIVVAHAYDGGEFAVGVEANARADGDAVREPRRNDDRRALLAHARDRPPDLDHHLRVLGGAHVLRLPRQPLVDELDALGEAFARLLRLSHTPHLLQVE